MPEPRPLEALRPLAPVQLIAVLGLALCTLIAATAVSIGLARAAGLTARAAASPAAPLAAERNRSQ
jgi:hypothetical protein